MTAIALAPVRPAAQGTDSVAFKTHMTIIAAVVLLMAVLGATVASPIVTAISSVVAAAAAFAGIYMSLNRIA